MLKIGIIGSGFGIIGLLPAFSTARGCEVVAVCARSLPKGYGCTRYDDWQQLLAHKGLEAVVIAVPPRIQYQIAKIALKKGLHVFAEKPLATNAVQARGLFTLAVKTKVTHGVDFIFQEIAEWKKVKEMLDQRIFGELLHVSASWDFLSGDIKNKRSSWKTDTKEGGGALSFYFSHGFYYLEHLAGEISKSECMLTHSTESLNGGEVGADMLLRFRSGATGYAHISCNSKGFVQHRLVFQCADGIIVLENENAIVDGFSIWAYSSDGRKRIRVAKDKNRSGEDERVKIVRKLAARFIYACEVGGQMMPSFKDGLRVHELIEKNRVGGFESKNRRAG